MKKIEVLNLWINGTIKTANVFDMSIVTDDLTSRAVFYYQLGTQTINEDQSTTTEWLTDGNLSILGADYQQWDADPSANEWAYNWAANKLNLTII